MDKTFVMLKPDAIQRNIVGKVISRFEDKGYYICAIKMIMVSKEQAEDLYKEHIDKDFYDALIEFTIGSPAIVMVITGLGIVADDVKWFVGRDRLDVGTIRGDMSVSCTNRNVIHASENENAAKREISIFFCENEITKLIRCDKNILYSEKDFEVG